MKTLTLNERLQQKQQEDMALIENQTRQQLQHFTDSLNKNVESELNIIKKSISNQKTVLLGDINELSNLRQKWHKKWKLIWLMPLLVSLSLMVVPVLVIQYEMWQLEQLKAEVQNQNRLLSQLKDAQQKLKVKNCDGRTCVQIDETAPQYTNGYRILRQ